MGVCFDPECSLITMGKEFKMNVFGKLVSQNVNMEGNFKLETLFHCSKIGSRKVSAGEKWIFRKKITNMTAEVYESTNAPRKEKNNIFEL